MSVNLEQADGAGGTLEEGPPQPCKSNDAISAAATVALSLSSSRRVTFGGTIGSFLDALARIEVCLASQLRDSLSDKGKDLHSMGDRPNDREIKLHGCSAHHNNAGAAVVGAT
jgi:hypothetical protein